MSKAPTTKDDMVEVDVGFVIRDLAGAPIQIANGDANVDLTLGHMLIQIVLAPPPPKLPPYTVDQTRARYAIARDIQEAFGKDPATIALDGRYVEELAKRIAEGYAPGIGGPALDELLK